MINQVDIRAAEKDLMKAPKALVVKFQKWVDDIEKFGLEEVEKCEDGMTIRLKVTAQDNVLSTSTKNGVPFIGLKETK